MRNTKSVAFPHFTHMYTSRAAHIAAKDKGSAVVYLCDGERERERKEREQPLVGVDGAAPAAHRRITLERTHHLCWFVELSHFNPGPSPLGTDFTPLHPTQSPNGAPRPLSPPPWSFSAAAVSISTSVLLQSGVRYTLTNTFTKATPALGLPHVCQEHQVGWRRWGLHVMLVCVPYILLLFERKKKNEKERNVLFKIFIFEG